MGTQFDPMRQVCSTPTLMAACVLAFLAFGGFFASIFYPEWTVGMELGKSVNCTTGYSFTMNPFRISNTSTIETYDDCHLDNVALPYIFFPESINSWRAFCKAFPKTSAAQSYSTVDVTTSDAISTVCSAFKYIPVSGNIIAITSSGVMFLLILDMLNDIATVNVRLNVAYMLGVVGVLGGGGAGYAWTVVSTNFGQIPLSELTNVGSSSAEVVDFVTLIKNGCADTTSSCQTYGYGIGFFIVCAASGCLLISLILIFVSQNLIRRLDREDQPRRDLGLPYYERTNNFVMKRNLI